MLVLSLYGIIERGYNCEHFEVIILFTYLMCLKTARYIFYKKEIWLILFMNYTQ